MLCSEVFYLSQREIVSIVTGLNLLSNFQTAVTLYLFEIILLYPHKGSQFKLVYLLFRRSVGDPADEQGIGRDRGFA